ncbi:MAG: hypothetical protein ACI4J1_04595 [Ruminiclostridium sp.]
MAELTQEQLSAKVAELFAINEEIKTLSARKKEIEALFLTEGGSEIENTKYKSCVFADDVTNHTVTYTEATSLSIVSPTYLKQLFGTAYPDIIKETTETKYKVASAAIERMLTGLFTGNYTKITPSEVLEQLPCTADQRKALAKKLKGASFETDKKALMTIGGFSEQDAADYAYLFADSVVWDTFINVLQLSGKEVSDETEEALIRGINISLAVDETQKISVK